MWEGPGSKTEGRLWQWSSSKQIGKHDQSGGRRMKRTDNEDKWGEMGKKEQLRTAEALAQILGWKITPLTKTGKPKKRASGEQLWADLKSLRGSAAGCMWYCGQAVLNSMIGGGKNKIYNF